MIVDRIVAELPLRIGRRHGQALLRYLQWIPPEILAQRRQSAFKRLMRLAVSHSSFYRDRFLQHGIDVKKVRAQEELGSFYLTSEELRRMPEALLCAEPQVAIESSGTTGHAARVYLSHQELDYSAKQGILLKVVYGLTGEDRVLSTFDYGLCLDGLLTQRTVTYWGLFGICAGRLDPLKAYEYLSEYRFSVVMSGTPWLARFTEVAQSQGRPYPLRLLIGGGGGGIRKQTRAWIEKFWEAPLCMTYASTEAASVLGFECPMRDGYHLNEFDFYVEIPEPDGDGFGEVVITTVRRKVMPLIRYRTRDVARFIPESCPCGLPFRRLSPLRGRSDEIVASVWGNVHPDFFEKLLESVPCLTEDWQVALQERNGKQTFEFRLEMEKEGAPDRSEVARRVLHSLETSHPLAWQAYSQGLGGVDFVLYPKGSLRKGRKLLRIVDERRPA